MKFSHPRRNHLDKVRATDASSIQQICNLGHKSLDVAQIPRTQVIHLQFRPKMEKIVGEPEADEGKQKSNEAKQGRGIGNQK